MDRAERERALLFVREAMLDREQAEASLWLQVAFARRCGVTWPQLTAVVGLGVETLRRKLREVEGRRAAA